jgi:hypothetical protein
VNTHKETIDVPDEWTVDSASISTGIYYGGNYGYWQCSLVPNPSPEPPIENCRYCGEKVQIITLAAGQFKLVHAGICSSCNVSFDRLYFTTRLAAIEAANRRAT